MKKMGGKQSQPEEPPKYQEAPKQAPKKEEKK